MFYCFVRPNSSIFPAGSEKARELSSPRVSSCGDTGYRHAVYTLGSFCPDLTRLRLTTNDQGHRHAVEAQCQHQSLDDRKKKSPHGTVSSARACQSTKQSSVYSSHRRTLLHLSPRHASMPHAFDSVLVEGAPSFKTCSWFGDLKHIILASASSLDGGCSSWSELTTCSWE